jgi:hypothetical protein
VNGDLIMNSDLIMNPIAIGVDCGLTNQSTLSIAIGYQAGRINQALDAIAIGDMAGNTAQGTFAIAIGSEAGRFGQNTSAIAIGTQSGSNTNALQGVNSICIGALARSTQANSIVLNASGAEFTASFASGFFVKPLRSNGGGNALNWNATTGEISQNTSQRVHKENIENLNTDTRVVLNLQPRTFTYKSNPTSGTHIGFIAEEVAEINPNFANYNVLGGEPVGINYNNITVFLLEEVKKLTNYVNLLKNALETLTGNPLVAPVVSEETPVAPEENPVAPEENPVIPEENPVAPQ